MLVAGLVFHRIHRSSILVDDDRDVMSVPNSTYDIGQGAIVPNSSSSTTNPSMTAIGVLAEKWMMKRTDCNINNTCNRGDKTTISDGSSGKNGGMGKAGTTFAGQLNETIMSWFVALQEYPVTAGYALCVSLYFLSMMAETGFAHPVNNPALGKSFFVRICRSVLGFC